MLHLLFKIGKERYALSCRRILRIVPWVRLRRLPLGPACILGLLNYRDHSVPVIDLGQLFEDAPTLPELSSRIILTDCPVAEAETKLMGFLAAEVLEVVTIDPQDIKPSGVHLEQAPCLGPIQIRDGEMVQILDLQTLLPADLRSALRENPLSLDS